MPPLQNFPTGQPAKAVPSFNNFSNGQPAKYYKKNKIKQFKSLYCLLRYEHRHLSIGIPGYIFRSTIKALVIPSLSWSSASPVLLRQYRVSRGRPYLQLYRNCAKIHYLCLYIEIIAKRWYLTKPIPFAAEFNYQVTSVACAGPINRPTADEGLIMTFIIYILQQNGWINNW